MYFNIASRVDPRETSLCCYLLSVEEDLLSCRDAGTVYMSFLMRDLWMMTVRRACMDVLYEQRLYCELTVNPWTCSSDYIHVGELRFMVTEEASVQDGVAVERRGPPSAFCFSTECVGTKTCSKRPI